MALAADVNPATVGQPVTLTATVTSAAGAPAGTVTFFDDGAPLGTVALDANGQAGLVVQLGPGTHSLTASFGGTDAFAASTSAALSETVTPAATATALVADPNPVAAGQPVTLTATVTGLAPGDVTPTGAVTFFDGATALGTAPLDASGEAVLIVNALTSGQHSLTASYGGDPNNQASTSDPFALTVT
jgi:large repetitive protein